MAREAVAAGLVGGFAAIYPSASSLVALMMVQGPQHPRFPLYLVLLLGPLVIAVGLALLLHRALTSRSSRLPGMKRVAMALEGVGALREAGLPQRLPPAATDLVPSAAPTSRGDEPTPAGEG